MKHTQNIVLGVLNHITHSETTVRLAGLLVTLRKQPRLAVALTLHAVNTIVYGLEAGTL
jgi:hypothetical protein